MSKATLTIDGGRLTVSGVLDFESVPDLDKQGEHWLASSAPAQCELDLAAVTYSSSVGIALVLGWLRAAARAHKTLAVKNIPADMRALARVGGLDAVLTG